MNGNLKRNVKYILVFLICLFVMIYGLCESQNLFEILKSAVLNSNYRQNFFINNENPALANIEPTYYNIIYHILIRNGYYQFDYSVIMSTMWFQVFLPLFSVISAIEFYQIYHSVLKMKYSRKNQYKMVVVKEMVGIAIKVACAIFVAYVIFITFVWKLSIPDSLGATGRTMFADILGNGFYVSHTYLYFILEGLVRFWLMPFAYAMLAESIVLLEKNIKEVIAAPIAYYYGMSAIGYAVGVINRNVAIYITPSVIMASGDFVSYNTVLMIMINMIPLFISLIITYRKIRHVEI